MIALNPKDFFTENVGNSLKNAYSIGDRTPSRKGIINRGEVQYDPMVSQSNIVPFSQKQPGRQLFEYFVTDLSNVSMHFSPAMRTSLTNQLKTLLSEENWDEQDKYPQRAAFICLLRVLSTGKIQKPPSIGANGAGSLTASWFVGQDRLTLDCFGRDRVMFVLTRLAKDGQLERNAGDTRATLLIEKLQPYNPEIWFS